MKMNFLNIHISEENSKLFTEVKNFILIIVTVIDLIFIFIITIYNVSYDELLFMSIFDLFVCFLLFLNLITIYRKSDKNLLDFIKTHVIDILSMIPFNFIFLRFFAVFRLVRLISLLQLFQIFKIYALRRFDYGSLKYFVQNRLLKVLTFILVFYTILSSIILQNIDPSFTNFFDSLWYNIVTLSGVGYGDITPISTEGKLIGIITIIMGVLFLSIFTAAMSSLYMEKPEEKTRLLVKSYIKHLKNRNRSLQKKVDSLDRDVEELQTKLDEITQILKDNIDNQKYEKEEDS